MKIKLIKAFLILFILEGLGALIYYFSFPAESASTGLFHQSYPRLILAAGFLLFILLGVALLIRLRFKHEFGEALAKRIDRTLVGDRPLLQPFQVIFISTLVFAVESFFLTFISLPPFLCPLTLWVALACLQAWLFLRITYKEKYILPWKAVQIKWRAFSSTQRKVFIVLLLIGLVYFCIFIPLNAMGWNGPAQSFASGIDDDIQYPIAVRALTPGNTFSSTVYHVLVDENNVYGHPYVTLSSLVLIPSRIIFGAGFGDHIQINLLLLRQFMNVLPMVLSMFLLVYIVTRFRSMLQSTALFALLLTIPGVVKFNIRFYHPDSLILLLIVLTIFFLQRDQYRFKKNFYLAAAFCGLAAIIKLWGFFFFLPVAVYLLSGLFRKILSLKKTILVGLGFILVMGVTMLITTPSLLVPAATKEFISGVSGQISNRSVGYSDPGSSDVYNKDFPSGMKIFEDYYIQTYYFFFCFACLAVCSFLGEKKLTAQIMLGWCLAVAVYMIYFLAAKSYWYLMELMVPLYAAPFLLPTLAGEQKNQFASKFLTRPVTAKILWGVVTLFCGSQFVVNLVLIATSPVILNYAR